MSDTAKITAAQEAPQVSSETPVMDAIDEAELAKLDDIRDILALEDLTADQALDRIEAIVKEFRRPQVSSGDGEEKFKFEIFKDWQGEFRWRLRSRLGQVVATSAASYESQEIARRAAREIRSGLNPGLSSTLTEEDWERVREIATSLENDGWSESDTGLLRKLAERPAGDAENSGQDWMQTSLATVLLHFESEANAAHELALDAPAGSASRHRYFGERDTYRYVLEQIRAAEIPPAGDAGLREAALEAKRLTARIISHGDVSETWASRVNSQLGHALRGEAENA